MTSSVTNGRRVTSGENSEYGISPVEDRMPAPNTFVSPASSIRPNSMLNQLNRFSASTCSPCVRGRDGLADEVEQLGVVAVHQRRDVAEAVVDHVRLGRELRVRAVAEELRHRKAAVGDVLVEGAVGQRPLGGDEVHVRFAPQPVAEDAAAAGSRPR